VRHKRRGDRVTGRECDCGGPAATFIRRGIDHELSVRRCAPRLARLAIFAGGVLLGALWSAARR